MIKLNGRWNISFKTKLVYKYKEIAHQIQFKNNKNNQKFNLI